jgi:DNA-binding CsgD family transcriptional regulator
VPLGPDDLIVWAESAYMLGRDDDYVVALERAHHAYVAQSNARPAARAAFWIGHNMLFRGRPERASGWFAVGERALVGFDAECAEHGYLQVPLWLRQMGGGDWQAGYDTACTAAAIGTRCDDPDLVWLARDEQARALLGLGRVDEALRLVDETLVVVDSGVLSPRITGIVYCNTIAFCRDVYQLEHAREWTDALNDWCVRQPEMVAHQGLCLVHRAEVMQSSGSWERALEEAAGAAERFTAGALNQIAWGKAHYRAAEIHRLQGRLVEAERLYREAHRRGCPVQPGLALLRLEQGQTAAAASAIREAVIDRADRIERADLLPSYVQIMVAAGDLDAANAAARDLVHVADRVSSASLRAMADYAESSVAHAEGDWRGCLVSARSALEAWHRLDAPYEAARARMLVAQACRALGDDDSAALELDAARQAFAELGAGPDLRRVDALREAVGAESTGGLSPRELEVLRLVARGNSNRQIAGDLVISERTVARHLQNIYSKLGVASRTAASAFAYDHDLV